MGGLLPEVERGSVAAAAAVVVVVMEAVGLEARQTLPLGVRPTPASLHSSSSWIWTAGCAAGSICRTPSRRQWTQMITGYWLQVDGYLNGPSWVEVEYTVDDSMLLGWGWKAFARSRHLTQGQYLTFEYDGDETLPVKIFRTEGGRVDCCAESDSSSSSSCYDDEDKDEDEEDSVHVKVERSPLP